MSSCCTHSSDGLLQLLAVNSPTLVPIEGHKGALPGVQSLPQLPEFLKAHGAGHVPLTQQSVKDPSHTSAVIVSFKKHFTQTQSLYAHVAVRENVSTVPENHQSNLTNEVTVR